MNYLHGVRVRMYQLGAVDGDALFDLFGEAERALRRLSDELHNPSISGPRRPWEPGDAIDRAADGPGRRGRGGLGSWAGRAAVAGNLR